MDKLGILLTLLRLMSISLQLISVARQVFFGSIATFLALIRLLATAVTLAQKILCKV